MKHLLNNFKKVSSDEKSATFRHKDGHVIKIAKKSLSKGMQKELDALPNYDEGGEITKYDDTPNHGYDLYHEGDRSPASLPTDAEPGSHAPPYDAKSASADKLGMTPDEMDAIDSAPAAPADQQQFSQPGNDPANYSGPVYNLGGTNTGPVAQGSSPPSIPQQPSPSLPQQPSPPQSPGINPDLYSAGAQEEASQLKQGMQGFNESQKKEADISGRAGDVAASEAMARNDALTKLNTSYQKAHDELTQHRQDLISDIQAGHIDPKHYISNMSGGQKVGTAIGLILSGFGSGLSGQSNAALDFLNKQIDRDIEAQKLELGKKENLLSANFKATGDLNDAVNMTRVNMADIYSTQLQRQAAQMQGPLAQARAQQAASQLQMKVAPELGQLTQKMAMGKMLQQMQGQNMSPESKIQIYQTAGFMSPEESNKAMEELKASRDAENVKNNILTAANKITNEQTLGNRVMSPFQSKQQIDNLNAAIHVQAAKILGARYTPEVAKEMDNLTAGLTTGKTTANQMQATLNNIFGQKENYPYLNKWGLNGNSSKAFNSQGQSNFKTGEVK